MNADNKADIERLKNLSIAEASGYLERCSEFRRTQLLRSVDAYMAKLHSESRFWQRRRELIRSGANQVDLFNQPG